MRKVMVVLIGFFLMLISGLLLAQAINIRVRYKLVPSYLDQRFIDGKFYRRPIHPGFITQKLPRLKGKIAVRKGPRANGLQTAEEFRK